MARMSGMSDHCMDMLRASDRERYAAILFAPQDKRPALAALQAFDIETARIRDLVSEPMPGEIRLQWWREVVTGDRDGEARQNPVASALIEAIDRFSLSRAALVQLLDARVFDLYDDPMPDRVTLEGYLGETVSVVMQLSAQVLAGGDDPGSADAAGHGGVALGIARILRQLPIDRARSRVVIPSDILGAAGTDPNGWVAGEDRAAMARAISIMVELGCEHLRKADAASARLDAVLRPAFLPLATVARVLAQADKAGGEAGFSPVSLSPLSVQWRLFRRALTG